jgi:CRP-like cAMP-binding protein
MKVSTNSPRVEASRRTLVELLLSEHPRPCKRHQETHDCELELLGEKYGITQPIYTPRAYSKGTDLSNFSIAIDHGACILCDRCVRACTDVAGNLVIGRMGKGSLTSIAFDANQPMGHSSCVNCGWCMVSCPTGAITYSGGAPTQLPQGQPLSAEDLKNIPLFAKISAEFLKRSEGAVVLRQFKKGEIICRQGDYGSTAFWVDSGSVEIFLETEMSHVRTRQGGGLFKRMTSLLMSRDSDKRAGEQDRKYIPIDAGIDLEYSQPVATVGAQELIGEASCLNHQPRSATMRAAEDTVVLEMLRNVLDILRRQKSFKADMERKYRERALSNHLRTNPIFRDVPDEFVDYLRERVELISYNPGEMIFRQGDSPDAFYLVRMGHVKVEETYGDGQSLVLSYLSRSDVFGEIGLLGGIKRTATCSALDHVELVKVPQIAFDEVIARHPEVRQRLEALAQQRIESNRQRASAMSRVSLQQYIDQGLYEAQSLLILDLEKCTRCDECVRACAQAHDGVSRLLREGLRYDKYLVTTSCRSCRDPLCMVGCPVGSIRRKNDLEIIIEDWCVGCGNCAENCPYGNINMHPFNVTDPEVLAKGSGPGFKAAVCDLCTDQCLGENEQPSCVYACPHDAAHRVDGQSFFQKELFGGMKSAAKH